MSGVLFLLQYESEGHAGPGAPELLSKKAMATSTPSARARQRHGASDAAIASRDLRYVVLQIMKANVFSPKDERQLCFGAEHRSLSR
jgi:hypothetical protein